MPEKMRAVSKPARGKGAELVETEIPTISDDEVLIKVVACSICGTDRHIYNWDTWASSRIRPPLIFGHECCGEVVEVGKNVKKVKVGDLISAESHIPCLRCKQCLTGDMHLCRDVVILGVDRQGIFAHYAAIPEICCWKNNPDIDVRLASVMEPLGNSVYVVMESQVSACKIAIIGDGPTSAFAAGIARAVGAARIYDIGMSEYHLNICQKMGADVVINITKETQFIERIKDETGGGVDVVLDMAGNQKAVETGFQILRRAGTYTAFGIPPNPIMFDLAENVIFKGARVIGINGRKMFQTWYQMDELLNSGLLDPTPVITHVRPFSQALETLKMVGEQTEPVCKAVLYPMD